MKRTIAALLCSAAVTAAADNMEEFPPAADGMTRYVLKQPGPMAGKACDWPRFRGVNGDSITTESGWRPEALAPSPRILWHSQVGEGYSGTCIGGPYLYTMGYRAAADTVYCLDVETGREIWRHAYPSPAGSYPGPRATPLFSGGFIYTVSRNGKVFCLDAATAAARMVAACCAVWTS